MDESFPISELILYKNNQLIAFNKPPAMPIQPDPQGDKSLLDLARIYSKAPVYLIHRIDRPASGVVLLAKTKKAAAHLNQQFAERTVDKTYLALVKKEQVKEKEELVHFLYSDPRANKSRVASKQENQDYQRAEMAYTLMEKGKELDLLQIALRTGRHHQIRAQLAAIGAPIRGDNKYGYKRGNRDRSIQLHSWKLTFSHPVSGERTTVIAPPPKGIWDAFTSINA